MTNVPPGGGFPPPPSGPPPGGGFPPPPPGGGGFPPPPPGGGGFPPPGGGSYGAGGFQGATGAPVEWQDRLISGLIDIIGPYIIAGALSTILGLAVGIGNATTSVSIGFNWPGLVVGALAVAWVLYQGHLAGTTGQSMGMKQAGLRMVDEATGQVVGSSRGLQRNALYALVWFLNTFCCLGWLLLVIDSLFPLWDPKRQTLRDKIGKTVVIRG